MGSIFSVFGALTSIRPGRTSMLGSSLITWGILRETLYAVYARRRIEVFTFPTLLIATLLAFLSIKSDVRYLIRSFRPRRQKKEKKAWLCRIYMFCFHLFLFSTIPFLRPDNFMRIWYMHRKSIICNLFGLINYLTLLCLMLCKAPVKSLYKATNTFKYSLCLHLIVFFWKFVHATFQ